MPSLNQLIKLDAMAKSNTKQEKDHHANQLNQNKGKSGVNEANAKVHGNRGKQIQESKKGK